MSHKAGYFSTEKGPNSELIWYDPSDPREYFKITPSFVDLFYR